MKEHIESETHENALLKVSEIFKSWSSNRRWLVRHSNNGNLLQISRKTG